MTIYPEGRDSFRRYVSGVDDVIAQDLNDIFDLAVAVETELGIEPSGNLGTVLARLFAKGNLSKINGGWRRQDWYLISNKKGIDFDEQGFHVQMSWSKNRFFGTKTEFGSDRPAPFVAMQQPLYSGTGQGYFGVPWQMAVFGEVQEDRAFCWGRDGSSNRLQVGNSAAGVEVGVLVWGMI